MNAKLMMTVFLAGVLCAVLAVPVRALESDAKKLVRGTVIEITSEHIVIQEESTENDEVSQFELAINAETSFNEEATNEDIDQGDSVEIEYKETDGGKVAILINETDLEASDEGSGTEKL
ncbi:MAG: hypothetical protein AB7S78_09910 [Candidatus Omnitrophota bacterium]